MKELNSLNNLVEAFKSFPSIGSKTAERMGYSVLDMSDAQVEELIEAIEKAKKEIHSCPICGLLTEDDECSICKDPNRNHEQCIVLSNAKDVYKFENIESYRGVYHVLGGLISSIHGVGPDDLKINELLARVAKENIKEVIIATNHTLEGETTALYLAKLLSQLNVKVTRLAYGLPAGGEVDYADDLTIKTALDNRTDLK
jgi:recombination protein RecR